MLLARRITVKFKLLLYNFSQNIKAVLWFTLISKCKEALSQKHARKKLTWGPFLAIRRLFLIAQILPKSKCQVTCFFLLLLQLWSSDCSKWRPDYADIERDEHSQLFCISPQSNFPWLSLLQLSQEKAAPLRTTQNVWICFFALRH